MEGREGYIRAFCGLAAVGAGLLPIAGCADDGSPPPGPPRVVITDRGYDPATLEVEVGDRVLFVNRANARPHSARTAGPIDVSPTPGPTRHDGSEVNRATAKGFATHSLFAGEQQAVIFTVPRTYRYSSAFDPNMTGTIEVLPASE